MIKNLPKPLAHILETEELLLPLLTSWLLAPPLLALTGFYMGTIFGTDHVLDLQGKDMVRGGVGALIGLAIGVLFAIGVTAFYPRYVEAEIGSGHS